MKSMEKRQVEMDLTKIFLTPPNTRKEKILFWHRGLSINDIALGQLYYEKALASNIGTKLFYR